MFKFEIRAKDKKTDARTGIIQTGHGTIGTPAFVPVGTQAAVKSLTSFDLEEIGTQVFFVNTYHMYLRPGLEIIKKFGGLHKFMSWNHPLMTDSGGFQVFSLGDKNRKKRMRLGHEDLEIPLVTISNEGVLFHSHLDGSEHFFTPESSIEAQKILRADLMIAFDECASFPATKEYVNLAMQRTHRWAERSLVQSAKFKVQSGGNQALYGVVQGGVYEDLRRESARYISSLPFEGIAVGGVAVGESKKEMANVLDWSIPQLPEHKPRHLLGVGEIDDIFVLVEKGVDTFDCVMPTRLARMGHVLTQVKSEKLKVKSYKEKFLLDLTKRDLASDGGPIDEECKCFVCKTYSRAYLNHLFRAKELLSYRLATYHNLSFMENLMRKIRKSIDKGTFLDFKKEWLA